MRLGLLEIGKKTIFLTSKNDIIHIVEGQIFFWIFISGQINFVSLAKDFLHLCF